MRNACVRTQADAKELNLSKMCNSTSCRVVDLNAAISGITELLRQVGGDRLTLRTQLDPKLGRIKADPREINWMLVNLATSAYESTPAGSELVIATSNVGLDAGEASEMDLFPGAYVQVEIRVPGEGADAGAKSREIVRRAQGAIAVRSIAGQGVTVTVLLPRMMEADFSTTRKLSPVILVVDDDAAAREPMRITLEDAGYEVLEAANGREAESILAARLVHLMVTDVVMPEQDGLETIKAVRKSHPYLRIIAMSETPGDYQLQAAKLLGAHAVICKPLIGNGLCEAVRNEIGGPRLQ
jgi:two-component system, cell cycle sensor histidine kinase and response regulator CckA